jgi:hypothetical protein
MTDFIFRTLSAERLTRGGAVAPTLIYKSIMRNTLSRVE